MKQEPDMSRANKPIGKESSYNKRMLEEQQKRQVESKIGNIINLRKIGQESQFNLTSLMDFVEDLLHACGGEPKANFIDVSRDFIKILTRVPLKANLHPFLQDDSDNNPRFHKVVSQILMEISMILGVRWVQTEEGTILILSISRNN